MTDRWTAANLPDQTGRVAVVTGANAGIGFEIAALLAQNGAHVVLAVRNLDRGRWAIEQIIARNPHADVALVGLDLASLQSTRAGAKVLQARYPRIDLLVNNAGVMWTPKGTTADGFELQFGTNHLGHFALTGLLVEHMVDVAGSRIVAMSSPAHRVRAAIHFDDLQWERQYRRGAAYAQSKLANLLFIYELQRRLSTHGAATVAVAAHPGGCYSQQVSKSPRFARPLLRWLFQSPAMGALSPLRAASDSGVRGGQYYGPDGIGGVRGYPTLTKSSRQSYDPELQGRLWDVSEELTGVKFPL